MILCKRLLEEKLGEIEKRKKSLLREKKNRKLGSALVTYVKKKKKQKKLPLLRTNCNDV